MVSQTSPGPDWPVTEGRYEVGKRDSPVAICTMSSVDMKFPMDKVAIAGKCVTENLGVEKIVRNLVSNPGIRYLVICGRESMGHFVDNAIESLIENGVDEEGRIVGAKGGIPVLKNLSGDEIAKFRKQITTVNMAGETDVGKVMEKVSQLLEGKVPEAKTLKSFREETAPETPSSQPVAPRQPERIAAPVHPIGEWVQDPKGYFTILVNHERKEIIAEHHDVSGTILGVITGKRAEDIYHQIVNGMGLVSRMDHAAYLGRELAKAETALVNRADYEQDSPLKISVPSAAPEQAKENGMVEKSLTYMGAGVKEFVFRETRSRDEDEFRRLLEKVGLYRLF